MNSSSATKIAIVGLWHLGEIYSACLSDMGHVVTGISHDKNVVNNLKMGIPPLEEPGLAELILKGIKTGHLSYTTSLDSIKDADVLWVTHDTPVNDKDEVDVSCVWKTIEEAATFLKNGTLIIISSQLPVGTSRKIRDYLEKIRPDITLDVIYCPENLRLGQGISSFIGQRKIIIGTTSDSDKAVEYVRNIFSTIDAETIAMDVESAEMTKHAINSWLATSISFTNDLSDLCECVGADIEKVIISMKSEPRIGEKAYLFAGLGFSGGTLSRDLKALISVSQKHKTDVPVIKSVYKKNAERAVKFTQRLQKELGDIRGRKLVIFGVTYKPGTTTLHRSLPLDLERSLRKMGAQIRLYDPIALKKEVSAQTNSPFFNDPYEAATGTEAILVLSPNVAFYNLNYEKLASLMKAPLIIDAQNILVKIESRIRQANFRYLRMGK